jgi:CRISPR/Cas system CSM-associated protein Csm3 (group 7 of RAMP superfamily)
MSKYTIQLILLSDTTFSRGDGVAGLLDREVEHDEFGLPYLHGRTLKGLLGEEADNLLDAMEQIHGQEIEKWINARNALFGTSGSTKETTAKLHYGHAQLPKDLRETVELTLKAEDNRLTPQDVLGSLTAVRRQTAVNGNGVPHDGSLRSMRVILRNTPFSAPLHSPNDLTETEIALLSAAAKALRRAGTGRNRGRGLLQVDLLDADGKSLLDKGMQTFAEALT